MKLKSLKAVFASIFARPSRPAEPRPAEPCPADGHEFEVDGIHYIITSAENLTVEVVGTNGGSSDPYDMNIPASVTYERRTYSVTSIGNDAFYGCTSLTSVTIPNSVTSIGQRAFYNCSSLTSVTILNSVTTIGNAAFGYCSGLTSIEIPNSVTSIGIGTFSGCTGLTSIEIPNSVERIGYKAFARCWSLSSLTSLATTPPTCDDDAFDEIDKAACTLHVSAGTKALYQEADGWEDFHNIVEDAEMA